MSDEHADVLREAVAWFVRRADGGRGRRPDRRRPATRRSPERVDPPQRLPRSAAGDTRVGEIELAIPKLRSRQLLPELPGAAPPLRAGAGRGRPGGLRQRRLDAQGRPPGRAARPRGHEQERRLAASAAASTSRCASSASGRWRARYPYLWLDAKVEKVREPGGVRHKALVIAYGVHESGRREVIGLDVGEAETEAFWREFLRALRARGLAGVRLCVSDAHEGLKNAIAAGARLPLAALHRPLPARHARPLRQAPAADGRRRDPPGLQRRRRAPRRASGSPSVAERLRGRRAQGRALLLEAPRRTCSPSTPSRAEHWTKLRSTNPLERVNREIGRRTDVVGIFPNDAA